MSDEEYSMDELIKDLESLQEAGLVEIKGIDEDGQWLYGLTTLGESIVGEAASSKDKIEAIGKILFLMSDEEDSEE